MSHDLEMARGVIQGGYNAAVGDPYILQEYLKFPEFKWDGPLSYPAMNGDQELLDELSFLYPNSHIVIANGAKQALAAAMYSLKKVEHFVSVCHYLPSWPSYSTLARSVDLPFYYHHLDSPLFNLGFKQIRCITSPNNPDGSEIKNDCEIFDAVYASWVYGWDGVSPNHRILVGSASKLLGLSGARIGWLVTNEAKLAEKAKQYIELSTSGVTTLSQRYVAEALRHMRIHDPIPNLQAARNAMLTNGELFNKYLGDVCSDIKGVPNNGKGMFAFFEVKEEDWHRFECAKVNAKVALVSGPACGVDSYRTYRMSMGCLNQYTEDFLKALRNAL